MLSIQGTITHIRSTGYISCNQHNTVARQPHATTSCILITGSSKCPKEWIHLPLATYLSSCIHIWNYVGMQAPCDCVGLKAVLNSPLPYPFFSSSCREVVTQGKLYIVDCLLATQVVTGGNSKCVLIIQVSEFCWKWHMLITGGSEHLDSGL